MRILAISGSLRAASANTGLIEALALARLRAALDALVDHARKASTSSRA